MTGRDVEMRGPGDAPQGRAGRPRYGAVLLIGYGAPGRPEDVRPYLDGITRGRRVPPGRLEEIAHHYEFFEGRSPLTELTRRQASALEQALRARGLPLPAHVGMRNWHPYLHETLAEMRRAGVRQAIGIVMAPHRSYASWEQYRENVAAARVRIGPGAPVVDYIGPWFDKPGFIDAQTDRVAASFRALPEAARSRAALVFTAHSIPVGMAERSPYASQVRTSARLVAARLEHPAWRVAYQSRSGDPREPWLEPDVKDVVREIAAQGIPGAVVAPVGFVADHIEVLYDLDMDARKTATDLGLAFARAGTVMDHPSFIGMLADLVVSRVSA